MCCTRVTRMAVQTVVHYRPICESNKPKNRMQLVGGRFYREDEHYSTIPIFIWEQMKGDTTSQKY